METGSSRREVLRALGVSTVGGLTLGSTTASATVQGHGTTVTLLHDTHVHGRYANAFADGLSVSKYFGVMNDVAADADNVFRVGNGDDLASSVLSAVFDGRHVVAAFNAGGLDFDTFGNHDFDMGPETLREQVAASQFTWVSANVRESGDVFAADAGARRYALADVDGVTLGVTGLITPEAPEITSLGDATNVLDPTEALETVVPQMRDDGADAVVVLSHLSGTVAETVAESVDGVDAIVGDHAGQVLDEPTVVNDTILSFVGDQYSNVGELALDVTDSGVADHAFTLHDVGASDATPDPWVKLLQDHYESQLDAKLGTVIGRTTVPLDVRESTVRARESNVGNYIADALREDTGADVALMNGGGIRTDSLYFEDASDQSPADITQKLVVNVLPFPNTAVEIEVTGSTLSAALENGVSRVEEGAGRFPQVSGISYTYDPDAAVGERIVEATVGGDAIDPEATYALATNNFVAGGGDGYAMFADATRLLPANEGALLSDLIASRIEAAGTISPTTEGRITRDGSGS